jgi:hypothetical protein
MDLNNKKIKGKNRFEPGQNKSLEKHAGQDQR